MAGDAGQFCAYPHTLPAPDVIPAVSPLRVPECTGLHVAKSSRKAFGYVCFSSAQVGQRAQSSLVEMAPQQYRSRRLRVLCKLSFRSRADRSFGHLLRAKQLRGLSVDERRERQQRYLLRIFQKDFRHAQICVRRVLVEICQPNPALMRAAFARPLKPDERFDYLQSRLLHHHTLFCKQCDVMSQC